MSPEERREETAKQTAEARRLAALLAAHIRSMGADGAELHPCVDGQHYRVAVDEIDAPPPIPPGAAI